MKRFTAIMLAWLVVGLVINARAENKTAASTDSLSRAAATVMSQAVTSSLQNIERLGVKIDREAFIQSLTTALRGGDTGFTPQSADQYINTYVNSLRPNRPDTVSTESQVAFLQQAAKAEGAHVMPSGLVFTVITEGEGVTPSPTDIVDVNYVGKLSDGDIFDQTEGSAVSFNVDGVIPGFSEGLQMMKPGGTYRLTIPSEIAYGARGIPGIIPGNSALEFTVTLEGVRANPSGERVE